MRRQLYLILRNCTGNPLKRIRCERSGYVRHFESILERIVPTTFAEASSRVFGKRLGLIFFVRVQVPYFIQISLA